jgi:uncharacterized protein
MTSVADPTSSALTTMLDPEGHLLIGKGGETLQTLTLKYANRHGLITGSTGTGKTVTLQTLAEGFSRQGVPVFVADVKGDFSGISQAGKPHPKVDERVAQIGISNFAFAGNPVIFWDVLGKKGHPIRITVSDMGPILLGRLLELSEAQEGALTIAFAIADAEGLPLLDFDDLRSIIAHVASDAANISKEYGQVSPATIATIQRKLLQFDQAEGDRLFGEPALNIHDFMRTDTTGRGFVNVLAADELIRSPVLYSTFLLWLLSELFETLPEVGDMEKPRLVFFFDEAHLLFADAPKALQDKVEQVCRLIRSKGVGIYFITQSPQDIPANILGQMGNRVQHALRAFTPQDQKAVQVAAETFRPNPAFDTADIITRLGVGEALVSTLGEGGVPSIVEQTIIRPPASRIGAILDDERARVMQGSPVGGLYDTPLDRDSAQEMLAKRAEAAAEKVASAQAEGASSAPQAKSNSGGLRANRNDTFTETLIKTTIRTASSTLARQITGRLIRGVMGSLLK